MVVGVLVLSSSMRVTRSQGGRILNVLLAVAAAVVAASVLLIEAMETADKTEESGGLVKVFISD